MGAASPGGSPGGYRGAADLQLWRDRSGPPLTVLAGRDTCPGGA